jgi:DNA-binding ferritin-like protein (Dps family)
MKYTKKQKKANWDRMTPEQKAYEMLDESVNYISKLPGKYATVYEAILQNYLVSKKFKYKEIAENQWQESILNAIEKAVNNKKVA